MSQRPAGDRRATGGRPRRPSELTHTLITPHTRRLNETGYVEVKFTQSQITETPLTPPAGGLWYCGYLSSKTLGTISQVVWWSGGRSEEDVAPPSEQLVDTDDLMRSCRVPEGS